MANLASAREYFDWTDSAQYKLANAASKFEGYKKTGMSMKVKWELILAHLKKDKEFASLNIQAQALQNKFNALQNRLLTRAGVTTDAVNLSGKEDAPADFDKLMLDMAEEAAQLAKQCSTKKASKMKIQKALLTHEAAGMRTQGNFTERPNDTSIFAPQEDDGFSPSTGTVTYTNSGSNSDSSGSGGSGSSKSNSEKRLAPQNFFDKISESIRKIEEVDPEDAQLEREEKRQRLRQQDEEHELRMLERKQQLDLEKKRVENEERSLKIQEQQNLTMGML